MKKLLASFLVLAMALALSACGAESPESPGGETVVTDMVGREVEVVPGSYRRVVCVGAGALRMYSYICGSENLAGVEDIDNESLLDRPKIFDSVARPYLIAYGDDFEKLPSCGVGGPMAQTAEAEKILACEPDIVISEYEDADKARALEEQLGVPVITLRSGADGVFDESFHRSLALLGKIFEKEERARTIVSFIQTEVAEIAARTSGIADAERPSVYICGLGNWGTTNHLVTAEDYTPFEIAGVKNAVSGLATSGVQPIEEELFVALGESIDIMIIDAAAVKNIKPLYAEDGEMFDAARAFREGEVYLQMAYNAYYTNYEISLANTWFIAKTAYPELFSDVDISEKMSEICEVFLGVDIADEIFAYPTSFGGYQRIDAEKIFK